MRRTDLADADCGIAQALGVLGDWWTFLIVRDVAGGTTRFDALQRALGVSRRALTERLAALARAARAAAVAEERALGGGVAVGYRGPQRPGDAVVLG